MIRGSDPLGLVYIVDRDDRECERRDPAKLAPRVAAAHRAADRVGAGSGADRQAAPAGVVRRPRHERRDALGGGAEARAPDPERALLRPQPHAHADDRSRDVAAARPRRRRAAAARAHLPRPRAAALEEPDLGDRVRRQRPQLLRQPAGHAGERDAVEARRHRAGALARRAARRGARPRRAPARRGRRAGRRPRRPVRDRRRRLRPRPPAAPGRQGARRRRCSPTR